MRRALLLTALALAVPQAAAAHDTRSVAPEPLITKTGAPGVCPGDAIAPTRVITGEFDAGMQGAYVLLPFDVPQGTTAVRVKYCHDQPESSTGPLQRHTLDMGVYDGRDAGGFFDVGHLRGWGGSSHPDVTISAEGFSTEAQYKANPKGDVPGRTTRGYRPGAPQPGEWAVELGLAAVQDTNNGDADGKVGWRVEIQLSGDPAFADEPYSPAPYDTAPAKRAAGWYAGDLHVHAENSALGDATMREVFDYGFRQAGLDFIALSDYVGSAQWGEVGRYQRDYPGKLVLRSAEVITYRGHTNNHASATTVDYRTGPVYEQNSLGALELRRPARNPSEIFDAVHASGGFTEVNHPTIFPSDQPGAAAFCRGCPWDYSDSETQWDKVDAFEVATGPYNPFTLTAIREFDQHRRQGHDITAVGVSDSHNAGRTPGGQTQSPVGTAATVVYADELSEQGVERAVKAGRAFVKVLGAKSPDLRLTARTPKGATAMMGDGLAETRADFLARVVKGGPSSNGGALRELIVLRDGVPQESVLVTSDDFVHRFSVGGRGDIRLQLYKGTTVEGLTNPITLGATATGGPPVNRAPLTSPQIRLTVAPRAVKAGRTATLILQASYASGGVVHLIPGANIRVAGRRARTDARGRARVTVPALAPGSVLATATLNGLRRGSATVRVRR